MRPLRVLLAQGAEIASFSRRDGEITRGDPSLLRGGAEKVLANHHIPIELLVFKENVLSEGVSDALLLGDRVEVEALTCGFEGLWSPKLERLSRAHDHTIGEQSARICLRCLQTFLWSLVLWTHSKLLWRYMLRFLLFTEDMRLDFVVQRLLNVSNAYATSQTIRSKLERLTV